MKRVVLYVIDVFFFKQKTAYEMRISDWSSDVCSSDLSEASASRMQALPRRCRRRCAPARRLSARRARTERSEEHTSELQSLMRISYAVFCLKKQILLFILLTSIFILHTTSSYHHLNLLSLIYICVFFTICISIN